MTLNSGFCASQARRLPQRCTPRCVRSTHQVLRDCIFAVETANLASVRSRASRNVEDRSSTGRQGSVVGACATRFVVAGSAGSRRGGTATGGPRACARLRRLNPGVSFCIAMPSIWRHGSFRDGLGLVRPSAIDGSRWAALLGRRDESRPLPASSSDQPQVVRGPDHQPRWPPCIAPT